MEYTERKQQEELQDKKRKGVVISMELVMEEFGQTLLAMLVMVCGVTLVSHLLVNEGVLNELVAEYMRSICG